MVAWDFCRVRVVVKITRCELLFGPEEVRNSSINRWQIAYPRPLECVNAC